MYVIVNEQYMLDKAGNKKDCVILCIVWWTLKQIQIAWRFVSDILAKTDATFNINKKHMLLQCFVRINNTDYTFDFLQAFSAAKLGRIVRFILEVLLTYYFYNCPRFAVFTEDFGSGLTAEFAQKAAQDAKNATERKRKKVSKTRKEKV
jgi:hypothetical protein